MWEDEVTAAESVIDIFQKNLLPAHRWPALFAGAALPLPRCPLGLRGAASARTRPPSIRISVGPSALASQELESKRVHCILEPFAWYERKWTDVQRRDHGPNQAFTSLPCSSQMEKLATTSHTEVLQGVTRLSAGRTPNQDQAMMLSECSVTSVGGATAAAAATPARMELQ